MEKLFENKTTYTQETYVEFLKFHNKTYNLSYMLYTAFWVCLLLLSIYLSFAGNMRIQGVLLTLVLIGFVFYRIYRPKMIVNREMKSEKVSDNNTNTFNFYDKNLVVKNNNGSFTYKYLLLRKVFETKTFFYLYVTKEDAFLVAKDSFTVGSSEEFSTFIKKKCSLKYRKRA